MHRMRIAPEARPWLLSVTTGSLIGALFLLVLMTAQVWARPYPASFADLAERVSPAVVNVSTSVVLAESRRFRGVPQGPMQEFFEHFFGRPPAGRPGPRGETPKSTSLGSGFIIDSSGYVVTNNHVVGAERGQRLEEITITLQDGRSFPAEVVGTDDKTDLALLKVETDRPLPHVTWGDSDRVRPGDWVIAIGNPFGLGGSISVGVISARGRDIHAGPYDDFLQLDAAINRGNSGGPSFDIEGRVIGVNTAIFSPNGGNIGIGFAIPSNMAREVIEQLKQGGKVVRGWLGVKIQDVDPDYARQIGLGEPRGARVMEVTRGGPADRAGLRADDIILRFNGEPVSEMRVLPRLVAAQPPGSRIAMAVWRDGRRERMRVELGNLDSMTTAAARGPARPSAPPDEVAIDEAGMILGSLSPANKRRFGIPGTIERGAVITDIAQGSPAAMTGLQTGDVVLAIGREPIANAKAVRDRIATARQTGQTGVTLRISRNGSQRFVFLRLS